MIVNPPKGQAAVLLKRPSPTKSCIQNVYDCKQKSYDL